MNYCNSSAPYPKIEIYEQDLNEANRLFNLYCGPRGEISGVCTYIYQSLITKDIDKALSEKLECIAICEMKHFEMLGYIICKLGARPRFTFPQGRRMQYWGSGYVNYETDIKAFMRENYEDEIQSTQVYRDMAKSSRIPCVKEILERIAFDEEHHAKIFEDLMQ